MTIEDPVEYVFPSINQIQINEQAGITFAGGLQGDPAPGPRRDPRRRDARRRDRADRRPVGAHRPLRALVAARDRRRRRAPPLPRHGHRVVPRRVVGARRRRPAARPPDLQLLQRCRTSRRSRSSRSTSVAGGAAKGTFLHGEGCNFCFQHRLRGARSASTSCCASREEMKQLLMRRATHDEIRQLASQQGMRTLRDGGIAARRPRRARPSPKSSGTSTRSEAAP